MTEEKNYATKKSKQMEEMSTKMFSFITFFIITQGNYTISIFIFGILPRDDISLINHLLIKETSNILKSSCSVHHIKFINQDARWIQMSGSLKPDLIQISGKGKSYFSQIYIYFSEKSL